MTRMPLPEHTATKYSLPNLRVEEHCRRGAGSQQDPEDRKLCCESMSPSHSRSYTHKVSPTQLPQRELDKDDTSAHAKLHRKSTGSLSPAQRTTATDKAGSGGRGVALPREEHANGYSPHTASQSVLKICIQIVLYEFN